MSYGNNQPPYNPGGAPYQQPYNPLAMGFGMKKQNAPTELSNSNPPHSDLNDTSNTAASRDATSRSSGGKFAPGTVVKDGQGIYYVIQQDGTMRPVNQANLGQYLQPQPQQPQNTPINPPINYERENHQAQNMHLNTQSHQAPGPVPADRLQRPGSIQPTGLNPPRSSQTATAAQPSQIAESTVPASQKVEVESFSQPPKPNKTQQSLLQLLASDSNGDIFTGMT